MPDKRYHIHVICSPDDQVEILDGLAIFMEKRAFLTRDLMQGDTESAGYSRRCIDDCDYLFMLVGDSYGKLHNTGVSQLHLSYIYAKTKAKPIVIFLKSHNKNSQIKLTRQYQDFTLMVEKQNPNSIYYYDENIQVKEFLAPIYQKLITEHKKAGWKKSLLNESPSLHSFRNNKSKQPVKVSTPPVLSTQPPRSSLFDIDKSVNLDVEIMVNFTAHAYQESNLKDVTLMASLTWRQVLTLIADAVNPMYLAVFQRAVNSVIEKTALDIVQKQVSKNVHAVSRVQVSIQDTKWLISQMIQFGWISQSNSNHAELPTRSKLEQDLLLITELGKQKLQTG